MQKAMVNYCINSHSNKAMKVKHRNNREQDNGIGTRSLAGKDNAWLPRSSASKIHAIPITKDKTLFKIINKITPTKIGTWNIRMLLKSGRFEELKQQMELKQLDTF